jgi:hypothetical protein
MPSHLRMHPTNAHANAEPFAHASSECARECRAICARIQRMRGHSGTEPANANVNALAIRALMWDARAILMKDGSPGERWSMNAGVAKSGGDGGPPDTVVREPKHGLG